MRKLTLLRAWLLVVLLAVPFSPLTGTARAPQGTPEGFVRLVRQLQF